MIKIPLLRSYKS
jgi:hypothetical protein